MAGEPLRDGSVGVFHGRVRVTDPVGGGQKATLAPGPGTKVRVNGLEITGPTEVTGSDEIEVEALTEPGQAEVKVEVSPDGLTATVHCEILPGRRFRLADAAPRPSLTLATRVEELLPEVTLFAIEQALQEKGVFLGLDAEAMAAVAADPAGPPRVVARGVPPKPGKDAWIELKFEEKAGLRVPEAEVQKVDWRELARIPTVEAGQVLAVKHPPVFGQPGRAVTGQPIEPAVPMDVELVAGDGCEVQEGVRVVATRSGRPAAVRGRIEVFPILVVENGVSLASGNVKFIGDVLVKGNVEDTMAVQAGGNIEVTGHATHAQLTAGGQIVVRQNLIGGLARAGGVGVVHMRCQDLWEELARGLEECAAALVQIAEHPQYGPAAAAQGWGRVLQKLLDTRFRFLRARLGDLTAAYREVKGSLTCDVEKVLDRLQGRLTGRGSLALSGIGELWGLAKETRNLLKELQAQFGEAMSFVARYVQGARVEASGDIVILGQGCYQAFLYAGGGVRVRGRPGVVRGGVVQARERISVNVAGSASGSPTLLKVDARGRVEVGTVHPNVTIQVGSSRYKFESADTGVDAHLDEDGQLVLH